MTKETIEYYKQKLNLLRSNELEFESYCFKFDEVTKKDVNQQNRYNIGVGIFNDLRIPEDYNLVQRLLDEEIKHRESNSSNYNYEVIYMYFYFTSEFDNVSDIWKFSEFKFDGSMDSDSGFETGFLLSYGIDRLKEELESSQNPIKEKIYNKLFLRPNSFEEETGERYKQSQIDYFGFKHPIKNPLHFYQILDDKHSFKIEFTNWINSNPISNRRIAYDYIHYAEYSGIDKEIVNALELYLEFDKEGTIHNMMKKRLDELRVDTNEPPNSEKKYSNQKKEDSGFLKRLLNKLKK